MWEMTVPDTLQEGEVVSAWVTPRRLTRLQAGRTGTCTATFEIEVVLAGLQERHYEDLVLEMGPGDLSLVPACEPHGFRSAGRDSTVLVIFFRPAFLGEEMLGETSWLRFRLQISRPLLMRNWLESRNFRAGS